MNIQPKSRFIWLGLALIDLPCLILIAIGSYQVGAHGPQLVKDRQWMTHSFAVITTIEDLRNQIRRAEQAQQGYLITGDAGYLVPYDPAVKAVRTLLQQLNQLTVDNAEQQARWAKLQERVDIKIREMQQTLDVAGSHGLEAARAIMKTNRSLESAEAITELASAADAKGRDLLTLRIDRVIADEHTTRTIAVTGASIAFVTLVIGTVIIVWAFRTLGRAERAEERFLRFVRGVPDYAIYSMDTNGSITSWNEGAQRIKGYTDQEILGQNFARFFSAEDQAADLPAKARQTAAERGEFVGEGWRVRKDGTRFFAHVSLYPERDNHGQLTGFYKITRDITQQKVAEQLQEKTRAELAQAQKLQALGQMSGGIAHDFNNLMHVIKNAAEILARQLAADHPNLTTYLDMLQRNADRGAALTQQLLAFARRQPLKPVRLSPNKLVTSMTQLLHRVLGESISIETVLGVGVWDVSVDANQLENAILNLAINSRDAMPEGGKLTIETANTHLDAAYAAAQQEVQPGQYVMIAVSDTGSGMNNEVAAQVFEPFFTTKETGKGTGLGLSQVHGFVKQSHGHINIYSEPGEGTTVKLYLPKLSGGEAVAAPVRQVPLIGKMKGTILIVEDNPDVLTFTAAVVRDLGYRVLTATDGATALKVMEEEPGVDLLFTDVGLPGGINGRQLADQIKANGSKAKVLFTTGYARNAIIHHGRLDEDVDLIVKPFTKSDVAHKLANIMSRAED